MKKNKVVVIIIILSVIAFCIFFVMPSIYVSYNYKINKQNKLIKIPYAVVEISPNEKITAEKIGYKNIKQTELPNSIYQNINDIIGKCTKSNVIISEEEFFDENKIEDCNN